MSELEPVGNLARKFKERAIAEDHKYWDTKNWGGFGSRGKGSACAKKDPELKGSAIPGSQRRIERMKLHIQAVGAPFDLPLLPRSIWLTCFPSTLTPLCFLMVFLKGRPRVAEVRTCNDILITSV